MFIYIILSIIIFSIQKFMFTSTNQFVSSKPLSASNSKSRLHSKEVQKTLLDTGLEFGTTKQQSFSFEVQAERQYVHRLKLQRQKIQALYSKYDQLLQEMKKKDQKIREQQKSISQLKMKYKQYSLLMPELDILRKQNTQLVLDNDSMRYNLAGIQESYITRLNQYKQKCMLSSCERDKVEETNEQLMAKIRQFQHKIEDKHTSHEKQKKQWIDKVQQVNKQMHELKNKHITQLSVLNTQLLHREQQMDIMNKQMQRIKQALFISEQSNITLYKDNQDKIDKLNNQFKQKIRSVKQEIEQHSYNNQILCNKITGLNLQIQKLAKENACILDQLSIQKQTYQQQVYQLKLASNQQKSILREHILQLQSKLTKLDKQLNDSLRRQKECVVNIRKIEQNQQIKRSLRDVERRQIQKINRLLLIDK